MAIPINVNGESINYPETGDPNWSDEATDFAVQTASAFGKLGLASGTSVDIPGTLDVTGNVTLDTTLSVGGNAYVDGNTTLTGNITVNGNSNLGNGSSDTVAVTGILNVDSGVLYVDPATNKVGINDTTPSVELDVNGSVAVSGTLGVTGNSTFIGNVITSIVKASESGGLTIDSNGGTHVALFGAGGGAGTTLYGGLNGTTGNFADTTDATTSTDGALKTAGGVGIAKKLFVGTDATLGGVLYLDDSTTANTPVLSFTGDTNTGIGRSAADTIDIITSGNSRLKVESTGQIQAVIPSGTTFYPGYLCRAWVNFNGTTASPSTIRGSGNVSSITKNATGDYTVNFITPMPDINYSVNVNNTPLWTTAQPFAASMFSIASGFTESAPLVGSFRFLTGQSGGGFFDSKYVMVAVYR